MKAIIESDGTLCITPDNSTEAYALGRWMHDFCLGQTLERSRYAGEKDLPPAPVTPVSIRIGLNTATFRRPQAVLGDAQESRE